MRKILFLITAFTLLLGPASAERAWSQSSPGYYSISDTSGDGLLSPEELDDLLAPIALYPDPLIAQILPAATFVDQIDEAARYVRRYGRAARVDDQPWDLSVRAVAHYPDVLYMMDQRYDWTVALGQAYLDQPEDVMDSIQALRAEARDRGNLYSTAQQQVLVESDGEIRIVPAVPQYIYVPVYDPQVIYVERSPSYGFITFGTGFAIGAWLSRDMDWRDRRVYYHGWNRGGWVQRSRPHIQDRRHIYINPRGTTITVNPKVRRHDSSRFRQELRREVQIRREQPGRPGLPPRSERSRPGRQVQQPQHREQRAPQTEPQRPGSAAPAPATPRVEQGRPGADHGPKPGDRQHQPPAASRPAAPGATAAPPRPAVTPPIAPAQPAAPAATAAPASGTGRSGSGDLFRGRDVQRSQPASRAGYGGYGSSKDASSYRERGQSSREKMHQGAPAATPAAPAAPAPAARPAPAAPPKPAAAAAPPAARPAPQPHAPRPVMPKAAPAPAAPAPPAAAAPAVRPEGRGGREAR
jgi:hypothetical protein